MREAGRDCKAKLLSLAQCEADKAAARTLSDYLIGARFVKSPGEKLGPVWKDNLDRKTKRIADRADELSVLLNEIAKWHPYNRVLDANGEIVKTLQALANRARAQRAIKNATALDLACDLAVMFLGDHSELRLCKTATGKSFEFVCEFAKTVFRHDIAVEGKGGIGRAYCRAVENKFRNSGQNFAPTSP